MEGKKQQIQRIVAMVLDLDHVSLEINQEHDFLTINEYVDGNIQCSLFLSSQLCDVEVLLATKINAKKYCSA